MKTNEVLKSFARDKKLKKKSTKSIIFLIQYKEKDGGSKKLHIMLEFGLIVM